jgi:hypothetical protein
MAVNMKEKKETILAMSAKQATNSYKSQSWRVKVGSRELEDGILVMGRDGRFRFKIFVLTTTTTVMAETMVDTGATVSIMGFKVREHQQLDITSWLHKLMEIKL